MRQRVLIAIALAGRPGLLIAGEPTSSLDATTGAVILDHLAELTRRAGLAVVLITHDLGIAADRADRMVVLECGRVVEAGPTRHLLGDPRHPHTRALVACSPSLASGWTHRSVDRRSPAPAGPPDTGDGLLRVEGLTKVYRTGGHPGRPGRPGRWSGRGGRTAWNGVSSRDRAEGRGGGNPAEVWALDGISFSVGRGETLAAVGESGAGKSTLARLLLRLTEPTAGRILLDGTDLTELHGRDLRDFRRRVQLIFQDPYASLDPRYTVAKLIEEPLRASGQCDRRAQRARVAEAAEQVALPTALLSHRPAELSGGECQRVAIARAIAVRPDLIVCDEVTSALDTPIQAQVLSPLTRLQAELGLSYLLTAHDLAVVRSVADRVMVMRTGRIVEQGLAGRVLTSPEHPYTGSLLAAMPGIRRRSTPGRRSPFPAPPALPSPEPPASPAEPTTEKRMF